METIVGKRGSSLAMQKHSRTISKGEPKIRIVHIFAPEIIKTDVANFRQLVQRLTGKPDDSHNLHRLQDRQKGPKKNPIEDDHRRHHHHHHQVHDTTRESGFFTTTTKTDMERSYCGNEELEDEEKMTSWSGGHGESSGGFLNSLGDLDGFIQELCEFPYLPFSAMDHHHHHHHASSSSSSQFHGVFAESHHQFIA